MPVQYEIIMRNSVKYINSLYLRYSQRYLGNELANVLTSNFDLYLILHDRRKLIFII
jgi:hypothetical protein